MDSNVEQPTQSLDLPVLAPSAEVPLVEHAPEEATKEAPEESQHSQGLKRAREEVDEESKPAEETATQSVPSLLHPAPVPDDAADDRSAKRARHLDANRYHVFFHKKRAYLLDSQSKDAVKYYDMVTAAIASDNAAGMAVAAMMLAAFKRVALDGWLAYEESDLPLVQAVAHLSTHIVPDKKEEEEEEEAVTDKKKED